METDLRNKIDFLVEKSKEVLLDCCLPNGAIVAANSKASYFPKEAKDYFFVWPRDGAYICLALSTLDIKDEQCRFFNWLTKIEDWQKTGLFFERYNIDGSLSHDKTVSFHRFQPDQTGIVLLAIANYLKTNLKKSDDYYELIIKSAHSLCKTWEKDHFNRITNDLWEERDTDPDPKDNFSYSLGACIAGLLAANELFPSNLFKEMAFRMEEVLVKSAKRKGYFYRSFRNKSDERIDTSLLGLIWPFEILKPDDPLAVKTVALIEQKLVQDYGVYRYENDKYSGWVPNGYDEREGAGFWPLLNFWMTIILSKMNRKEEAMKYFNKVLESIDLKKGFIPEQIFDNDIQVSVSPLAWSHAMFII
ncbi:MAG: glycoside hydrolase family 15 protein [Patescibacteria group bacterium]|nr:glycoside hydrolase family 15 protein [Patescibacteria group bacterium]